MNNDGTKDGFAHDITALFCDKLSVPVIASGGAGTMKHFADVFLNDNADAALAASVFHFAEINIPELKEYLITTKDKCQALKRTWKYSKRRKNINFSFLFVYY